MSFFPILSPYFYVREKFLEGMLWLQFEEAVAVCEMSEKPVRIKLSHIFQSCLSKPCKLMCGKLVSIFAPIVTYVCELIFQ